MVRLHKYIAAEQGEREEREEIKRETEEREGERERQTRVKSSQLFYIFRFPFDFV